MKMKRAGYRRPVFILGVGAQKAGTTWLSRYLRSYEQVLMGADKEYHVWDHLTLPEHQGRLMPEPLRGRERILAELMLSGWIPDDWALLKRLLLTEPDSYFRYFSKLVRRKAFVTGDITPAYCELSAETLQRIDQGFDRRGIETRAIFILRDPVERCVSAFRMVQGRDGETESRCRDDSAEFLRRARDPAMRVRTEYEQTYERLISVFGRSRVYLGFYESMFDLSELERLGEFLGLPAKPDLAMKRFRAGSYQATIDDKAMRDVAETFRPTYRYFASSFPQTKALWLNMPADIRESA